jgi:hypothetical protein
MFCTVALLGLAACAAEDAGDGDLPFAGEIDSAGAAGKPDHLSIPFTQLHVDIGQSRLERGGRMILTSARSWSDHMGTTAPVEVDFSREWIAFYGAGLWPTGGSSADVVGLELIGDGGVLVSTRSQSAGRGCFVTQAPSTPHSVVKFAIPSPRPFYAVGDHEHETVHCTP